jgi:hypothetical protein
LDIYWENVKNSGWGNKLQEFLKSGAPIPADAYHAPYCGTVPQICIYNQRVAKMRLELKKKKTKWKTSGSYYSSPMGKKLVLFSSSCEVNLNDA